MGIRDHPPVVGIEQPQFPLCWHQSQGQKSSQTRDTPEQEQLLSLLSCQKLWLANHLTQLPYPLFHFGRSYTCTSDDRLGTMLHIWYSHKGPPSSISSALTASPKSVPASTRHEQPVRLKTCTCERHLPSVWRTESGMWSKGSGGLGSSRTTPDFLRTSPPST